MFSRNREISYAFAAMAAVSGVYLFVYRGLGALPAASSLFGHGLGTLGVVLMLATETAYSVRKQLPRATWGTNAAWLRFHMVTGLVGPYMVLLHTSMQFRGLAAATTVLMGAVVVSGVIGRYLYTAVPRTQLGPERDALATWHAVHVPLTWALFTFAFMHGLVALYYGALQR